MEGLNNSRFRLTSPQNTGNLTDHCLKVSINQTLPNPSDSLSYTSQPLLNQRLFTLPPAALGFVKTTLFQGEIQCPCATAMRSTSDAPPHHRSGSFAI